MNQRKMFDDELDEMTVQHSEAIDKLKRMHSDEKNKVEQLLQQHKENTDHVGGTKKDAARYIEKRRRQTFLLFEPTVHIFSPRYNCDLIYHFQWLTAGQHAPPPGRPLRHPYPWQGHLRRRPMSRLFPPSAPSRLSCMLFTKWSTTKGTWERRSSTSATIWRRVWICSRG